MGRSLARLIAVGLLMATLGCGSAVFTAAVARPRPPTAVPHVVYASNAPFLAIASDAGHATAPPTATPGTAAPVATVPTGPCVSVPILLYHYIRVNPVPTDRVGWGLSVTPAEFQSQMDWLRQAGGNPVTMAQVMAALSGGSPLPRHAVVLTFDDGYADFATQAAPVLAREGFIATDYVVSGFIGRSNYMTASQVQQVAGMGMIIGAHTVHHVSLASLSPAAAAAEISVSKAQLEALLGHPVVDFAYPYGSVNSIVAGLVQKAGFREAVTTNAGDVQCAGSKFWLRRVRIGGSDTVASFSTKAGIPPPPHGWSDPGMQTPTAAPTPTPTATPSPSPTDSGTPTPTPAPSNHPPPGW
jgi:peptidoglycan/xylan/chitin deacetylase (PgdA/CDA1 family)